MGASTELPRVLDPCRLLLALLVALAVSGCAGRLSPLREVRFPAPSMPDPEVRPLLTGVKRLGVLCTANLDPASRVDTELVLARLGHAVARQLQTRPGLTVVPQDQIVWQLGSVELDSSTVIAARSRQQLVDSLSIDAMVVVELQRLQVHSAAATVPPGPPSYGSAADSTVDLAAQLRMSLVNLHGGGVWQQSALQRGWKQGRAQSYADQSYGSGSQPVRVQVFAGSQREQQLLATLAQPLQRFLQRIAPPPRIQVRDFALEEP